MFRLSAQHNQLHFHGTQGVNLPLIEAVSSNDYVVDSGDLQGHEV